MKRYYNKTETPLKFHKVYLCIIALRILIGISLVGIFALYDDPTDFSNLFIIIYNALCATVCCFAFWGLFTETAYGWYANMLYLFLGIAYNLYLAVWSFLYNAEQFTTQLPARAVCLPFLFFTVIYYTKRKPLFFPNKYAAPVPQPEAAAPAPVAEQAPSAPAVVGSFCPYCGKKLKPDYSFCPNCGASR